MARTKKYIRREGTPGNYQYFYTEKKEPDLGVRIAQKVANIPDDIEVPDELQFKNKQTGEWEMFDSISTSSKTSGPEVRGYVVQGISKDGKRVDIKDFNADEEDAAEKYEEELEGKLGKIKEKLKPDAGYKELFRILSQGKETRYPKGFDYGLGEGVVREKKGKKVQPTEAEKKEKKKYSAPWGGKFEKANGEEVAVATAPVGGGKRGHVAYTKTVRGKQVSIPQKGAIIKEREPLKKEKKQEVTEKPEEVLHGKEHQQFTRLLDSYFHTNEEMKMMSNLLTQHSKELESYMSEIRPMLAKFKNLEKEENKFRTIFKEGDWDYNFLSFSRESKPYKDLYTRAFNMLNDMQKEELKTAEDALKKITAQEKFERKKMEKALKIRQLVKSYVGRPQTATVISEFQRDLFQILKATSGEDRAYEKDKNEKMNEDIKGKKEKNEKNEKNNKVEKKPVKKPIKEEPKEEGKSTYKEGAKKQFITSLQNLVGLRERGVRLLREFFSRKEGEEKTTETKKSFRDAVMDVIKARFVNLAKAHKYIRRMGTKGHWEYVYPQQAAEATKEQKREKEENAIFTVDVAPLELHMGIETMRKKINAPYVTAQISTLGGKDRASILLTVSLQDKKDWSNGILQNSPYAMFHLSRDGSLEHFSGKITDTGKMRKTKVKSLDDAVDKINKFISSGKPYEIKSIGPGGKPIEKSVDWKDFWRGLKKAKGGFRMARSGAMGEEEKESRKKEREASGETSPKQERMKELASRRKEEMSPMVKARQHKYIKRLGTKGNYTYVYVEEKAGNELKGWSTNDIIRRMDDINESLSKFSNKMVVDDLKSQLERLNNELRERSFPFSSEQHLKNVRLREIFKDPKIYRGQDIMSVEDADLTPIGLVAKYRSWSESEHGLEPEEYGRLERELSRHGMKVPEDIKRKSPEWTEAEKRLDQISKERQSAWTMYEQAKTDIDKEAWAKKSKSLNQQYYNQLDIVDKEQKQKKLKNIGEIGNKAAKAVQKLLTPPGYGSFEPDMPAIEGKEDNFSMDFHGDRSGGDGLFRPRVGVEDDDHPDFVGRNKVIEAVQAAVGKGYRVDAQHHEKGWFSVGVRKIV